MTEPTYCTRCDDEINEESISFDGEILCHSCCEEHTLICDHCGERIWEDDNCGNEDRVLCQECRDDYYSECCHCGRIIHRDYTEYDDYDRPYCESCYDAREDDIIHNYGYKPDPIFRGDGTRYFGVELEIDDGGARNDYAEALLDIANRHVENLYCKHDGSISDGFELVTHPMTLAYHEADMPWCEILDRAVDLGYLSHKTSTCGLHVHVNRDTFGKTQAEQEPAIARVLYFVESHWVELLRFSRRTKYQLEQWAARYGRKDSPKEILDSAKDRYERYKCVNLTNYATIEFRIFRGTLKLNTLIATLQLVNEICSVAISCSDAELDELSWTGFVAQLKTDAVPELVTYLKERRLYVNEPMNNEEDV
jgi:hypothetical protein